MKQSQSHVFGVVKLSIYVKGSSVGWQLACLSSPCLNGGSCSESPDGFSCDCEENYEGKICQITRSMCYLNPCAYGGTCHDDLTIGFYCICDPCFFGEFCEQDFDVYYDNSFQQPTLDNIQYNITVLDRFYLGIPQLVLSTDCELRQSEFIITMWNITTPKGSTLSMTIYQFDTLGKLGDQDGIEILTVATSPLLDESHSNVNDIRVFHNLSKPYQEVDLWIPGPRTDPTQNKVLLYAQGNLSSVLPFTVRTLSGEMHCLFYSTLRVYDIERYTTLMAKVLAV
ncbi:protein delta homolog 1-like [Lytechinus pictus]|uniref:protein delta homolog 1-like n=1 Tax=Lytechinus pictus TaxID=7653 RepID=UPI0030B9B170